MGLLTKEVQIIASGKSIKYYRDRGYDAQWRQPLIVKVEDLPLRSDVLVETECDYCGEKKAPIKYSDYNTATNNGTTKCCCSKCAYLKREDSMMKKYGYAYALQNPDLLHKAQQTNLERYGSVSPSGNKEVKQKMKSTLMQNYGVEYPSQSKEIMDKVKKTNLERYGVVNPLFNVDIQEKIKKTNLERYGVENALLNKNIRDKRDSIMLEKYGTLSPLQNKECIAKMKQTNLDKYGVENVSQLTETKDKVKQTNLKKYGYENPMQNPEFFEKWFAKNGSDFVTSSAQQRYLCNLYDGILNYTFKCFALDIYLPQDNLDIEFDGSGHKMSISLGSVTTDEFDKKELYRNIAIKRAGYKRMRVISEKDKLPSDEILLQMLEHTRKYFLDYPEHSWIEFNIDTSTVRNAEQKDGVFFDYGELRKIKKSEVITQSEQIGA